MRRLAALLGGPGQPPMIVLHGLLGSARNWLSTGRDLAKHHHVLALDARNHGKSPHVPLMNYEVMVDDLVAAFYTVVLAAIVVRVLA